MLSPLMGKLPHGNALNAPFNSSEGSPRREGRSRWVMKHETYYMAGGDLFVLIDDVLFRVHSYFFQREARRFFEDAPPNAATPAPAVGDVDGRSEEKPIRILDVTVQEFEQFLWVFYNPRYNVYEAPIESWFSILKLAHRWDFPVVKAFALQELKRREQEVPLVTRICLYQDYEAPPECLVPLYGELCARDLTPTEQEAVELGLERMYRVFKAREILRSPIGAGGEDGHVSPLPKGMAVEETYPTIEVIFGLPPYPSADLGDDQDDGGESHRQDDFVEEAPETEGVPTIRAPKEKKSRTKKKGLN